jgi:hypothetical protein
VCRAWKIAGVILLSLSGSARSIAWLTFVAVLSSEAAEGGFIDAITRGTPDLFFRYRSELVDDAAPGLKRAYASTLRSAIGYHTGTFRGFSVYGQFEDVRAIGQDRYNDGGTNNIKDRAVVVDPEGSEINQAFLRFSGISKTVLTYGRQEITQREAPLHRFIGNILFRQNFQSFDAFRAVNLSLPKTTIDYAYVWNVNRIFGEDNPLPNASDFPMRSHLLNVQYGGLSFAKIEGYSYLLDLDSETAQHFSTSTLGLRIQSDFVPAPKTKFTYAAEVANQRDFGRNATDINVNYFAAELGLNRAIGGVIEALGIKLNIEHLGGKGDVQSFQTPLGTNHAFQGFADRFLVTPGDGIRDIFATLNITTFGTQISTSYHVFNADRNGYRYGTEWNVSIERTFAKGLLAGLKYADYRADGNATNIARNTASQQAFDLTKFWVYAQYKY